MVGLLIEKSWVRSPQASPCCVREQDTLLPTVLVKPRKRWLRPDMTENLDVKPQHKQKSCSFTDSLVIFVIYVTSSYSLFDEIGTFSGIAFTKRCARHFVTVALTSQANAFRLVFYQVHVEQQTRCAEHLRAGHSWCFQLSAEFEEHGYKDQGRVL